MSVTIASTYLCGNTFIIVVFDSTGKLLIENASEQCCLGLLQFNLNIYFSFELFLKSFIL